MSVALSLHLYFESQRTDNTGGSIIACTAVFIGQTQTVTLHSSFFPSVVCYGVESTGTVVLEGQTVGSNIPLALALTQTSSTLADDVIFGTTASVDSPNAVFLRTGAWLDKCFDKGAEFVR